MHCASMHLEAPTKRHVRVAVAMHTHLIENDGGVGAAKQEEAVSHDCLEEA